MKKRILLKRIANNPKSARFNEVVLLLEAFGFRLARQRGSHNIFLHSSIPVPVNIQIVERFNLKLEE